MLPSSDLQLPLTSHSHHPPRPIPHIHPHTTSHSSQQPHSLTTTHSSQQPHPHITTHSSQQPHPLVTTHSSQQPHPHITTHSSQQPHITHSSQQPHPHTTTHSSQQHPLTSDIATHPDTRVHSHRDDDGRLQSSGEVERENKDRTRENYQKKDSKDKRKEKHVRTSEPTQILQPHNRDTQPEPRHEVTEQHSTQSSNTESSTIAIVNQLPLLKTDNVAPHGSLRAVIQDTTENTNLEEQPASTGGGDEDMDDESIREDVSISSSTHSSSGIGTPSTSTPLRPPLSSSSTQNTIPLPPFSSSLSVIADPPPLPPPVIESQMKTREIEGESMVGGGEDSVSVTEISNEEEDDDTMFEETLPQHTTGQCLHKHGYIQ